jgi:hypothetical protein
LVFSFARVVEGGAALGIVVESPQRALKMRAGKARTWNEKPGPLANGNAHIYKVDQKIYLIINNYNCVIIKNKAALTILSGSANRGLLRASQ